MRLHMLIISAALFAGGCASTPPFSCEDARTRIVEESEKAETAANEYHAAKGQKDSKYYGIKAARTAACIGSLGLLCGVADSVASGNVNIEKSAQASKQSYEKSASMVKGLRAAMEAHNCKDIPPAIEN